MKILIIRLSSLGDLFHALPCVDILHKKYPDAEIDWVVRSDFHEVLRPFSRINKIWSFSRSSGFIGWLQLCWKLRHENYSHIYDAHNNIRSWTLCWVLKSFRSIEIIRRSKDRWKRFLLFKMRKNNFPQPFYSAHSFLTPLKPWGADLNTPLPLLDFSQNTLSQENQEWLRNSILIAPSAAWDLKKWPIHHWKCLLQNLKNENFSLIGGPTDLFISELEEIDPHRIKNFAGKFSWKETLFAIQIAKGLISGDTGVMHMSDYLTKSTIALIGPSAFGYPSQKNSHVLEVKLDCKPCSKDGNTPCKNSIYKKCLNDITPNSVIQLYRKLFN